MNSNTRELNSLYNDKDLDGIPDIIDSSFDPPANRETEIADEKHREEEKRQQNLSMTR